MNVWGFVVDSGGDDSDGTWDVSGSLSHEAGKLCENV